jgi:hypothetical protein
MTPDLFWTPAVGDLVQTRPSARVGVTAFDDHPMVVRAVDQLAGVELISCESTGPVTQHTDRNGRVRESHPRWTTFKTVDELQPVEVA